MPCRSCIERELCQGVCERLEQALAAPSLREPLSADLGIPREHGASYAAVIADRIAGYRRKLRQAHMTETERVVLILRYFGVSWRRIAELLDMSVKQARLIVEKYAEA